MFCQVNLSRQWQFRLVLVTGVGLFYTLSGSAILEKNYYEMEKASLLSLVYSNCSSMPYLRTRYQCQLTLICRYIDIYMAKDMYIYLAKGAVLQSLMVMGTYTACTWNHMYTSPGIKWATVLYCTTGNLCNASSSWLVPCGDSELAQHFTPKPMTVLYLMKLGTSHHVLEPFVFGG